MRICQPRLTRNPRRHPRSDRPNTNAIGRVGFSLPFFYRGEDELESLVVDLLTSLPCFFLVLVAVVELFVVVPAGVETVLSVFVLVTLSLP